MFRNKKSQFCFSSHIFKFFLQKKVAGCSDLLFHVPLFIKKSNQHKYFGVSSKQFCVSSNKNSFALSNH